MMTLCIKETEQMELCHQKKQKIKLTKFRIQHEKIVEALFKFFLNLSKTNDIPNFAFRVFTKW